VTIEQRYHRQLNGNACQNRGLFTDFASSDLRWYPWINASGPRFGILTLETTGAFRFYHDWIVGGDEDFGETLRVIGAEWALANIPRITVMRVPAFSMRAGVTHVLNGAERNSNNAYLGISVTP
jgi:hypothetical protein